MKKALIAIAITVFISACGGGGGGSSTSVSTGTGASTGTSTGLATTQAVITAENASTMANQSSSLLTQAQGISLAYHLKAAFKPYIKSALKPQGDAGVFEDAFANVVADAIAALGGPRAAYTLQGACGGTLTMDVTSGSSAYTFANYCAGGTTMNGSLSMSGSSSNYSLTMDLTIISSSATVSMKGTISGAWSSTSISISMTLTCSGTTGGKTYNAKMENYQMTYTLSNSAYTFSLSGKFYFDQYGYVTLSTPVLLTGSAAGGVPSSQIDSGTIMLQAGGNTATKCVYTAGTPACSYTLNGTTWIPVN